MIEQDIATSRQAETELRQTGLAFELLERAMLDEMFNTAPDQTAKREKLFFAIRAIRMAHEALKAAASAGPALVNYQNELAKAGLTQP